MKTIKKTWRCVENCGACCNLTPEDRPDLESYLTTEELKVYLAMVKDDGWCTHLDMNTRKCSIYEDRPRFCRVNPDNFRAMYKIEPTEFNDFAIACCQAQIAGVYGEDSPEMKHYNKSIKE